MSGCRDMPILVSVGAWLACSFQDQVQRLVVGFPSME
jgi:hypothetical protein